MLLEQLVDLITHLICLCVPEMFSEVHWLSRRRREPEQESNENLLNVPIPLIVDEELDFEYEEFPVSSQEESRRILEDTTSFYGTNNCDTSSNTVNTEIPFYWFIPHKAKRGPLLPSILQSFPTVASIMLSAIAISTFAGVFAYLDLETTDKCIGIEHYLNKSIPFEVMKWKLVGESFQVLLLNFWFPATIFLLFGVKEFLEKFRSLLYIGLIMGLLVVIYKMYLFIFTADHDFSNSYKRYPVNFLFLLGVILSCIQIAYATRKSITSIVVRIGQIFVFSLLMAMSYRYLIAPWFNKITNEIYKAILAAIFPVIALIPVAVSKYVVLCHCSGFVRPDLLYILVYFNYLIPVVLYRIMQAELSDLRLFVAFSLLHGVFTILAQLTRHFRENVWGRTLRLFRRDGWEPVPYCSPRNRRLQADLEIQDMLSQFGTLLLSQVYVILYRFSTFDVTLSEEIKIIYPRVLLGLTIEFVFAWISTFIQLWLYNIAIKTVWSKYWRRHLLASVLIVVVTVSYFSPALLSVFMSRMEGLMGNEYSLRNCTVPFTYHKGEKP